MLEVGMGPSESGRKRILIVDDEESIRTMLAGFLRSRGFDAETAADAAQALALLEQQPFDLVLSDVNMPGMNGIELLSRIRRSHAAVGVLMLTGCEDVSMAVDAMKSGALDYVQKPFDLDEVVALIRDALGRRDEKLREASHVQNLERLVQDQSAELRRLLGDLHEASEVTLEALVTALDARERETYAHSRRVGEYAVHLARTMGIEGAALETVRRGATLHDLGKIGISDTILLKPGALTDSEWAQMRRHPQIGYWILKGIPEFHDAAGIVLSHHERFDGRGYPRHLTGVEIPLGARIFSVVDSLDAMTEDRPYHRGQSYDEARREIAGNSGTQFDPQVVDHFLQVPPHVWREIRERTLQQKPGPEAEITPLVLT
jgi:response regulator RpfG family c-di-GMP phosphodiesterase